MVRIFISFASANEKLAEELHQVLTSRGAEVFQFQKSAKAGQGAWEQVYNNIQSADIFVCLISRDSLRSRPVLREVEYADYCYINYNSRPNIVPVMLDDATTDKLPPSLRMLTPLELSKDRSSVHICQAQYSLPGCRIRGAVLQGR